MKKLGAIVVMLAVMGVSVPVYSITPAADYILVYKVTISGKVVDTFNDEIVSAKIQGYWVVSVDETPGNAEIVDSGLVIFGKLDGRKVYDTVTAVSLDLLLVGETGEADIGSVSMELPTCDVIMFGPLKSMDIGLLEKKGIPASFTGGALFNGTFFGLTNIMGSGTVSAKLDPKLTKANVKGPNATSVLNTIILNELIAKGYSEL